MNDSTNKPSICSIISIEGIDFHKKNEAEQVALRQQLDGLIAQAVVDIAPADRQIFPTQLGAVIICNGPLEDALEDALLIALTIRDGRLNDNAQSTKPWYVQIGINLGSVNLLPNEAISGEGVDEAKRIMCFAKPNQILVSRVYHEMASKLTPEIATMFEQYDMHAHHQDIYAVRLLKEAASETQTFMPEMELPAQPSASAKSSWQYGVASVLIVVVMFAIAQLWFKTPAPKITMDQPTAEQVTDKATPPVPATATAASTADKVPPSDQAEKPKVTAEPALKAAEPAAKKVKTADKAPAATSNTTKPHVDSQGDSVAREPSTKAAGTEKTTSDKEKSTWQTLKDSVQKGAPRACTQVEIAMNQCKQ